MDPVIEFAQQRFGPASDSVIDTNAAPGLPDWLAGRAAESAVLGDDDFVIVEGGIGAQDDAIGPVADGSTADDLAFYLPFHFYRSVWGIYVRASGVWALSRRIALTFQIDALMAAYMVLLEHERMHFVCEYAASRIEVMTAESSYREYFRNRRASEHEEALANARALHGLRRTHALAVAPVSNWMRSQPEGYRDFQQCMGSAAVEAERRAASFMHPVSAATNRLLGSRHPAEFLLRRPPHRVVPVHWVADRPVTWMRIVKPFPREFGLQVFVHSNDHKPPHIHIQAAPGRDRTRYTWPDLTPLKGDPTLTSRERRQLDQYVAAHCDAIDAKVRSIPWQ